MFAYIIRRAMYAIPVLIGVNLITFALFFVVNTPEDIARMHLGVKRVSQVEIQHWLDSHGYARPLLFNEEETGLAQITDTIFFQKSLKVLWFQFGRSDQGRDISHAIVTRMGPSLALAVPTLVIGMLVCITLSLLLVLFRSTYLDNWGVAACVVLMSISPLFYIIAGQYLFSIVMHLVPISGYDDGLNAIKFLILPVAIGVVSSLGASTRWYRTIFLEEFEKDYVRTARAKGVSEFAVLFRHTMRNGLLPILTSVVVILPLLFMGSLIMESFFGIPGLGAYTIHAIQSQDFAIVRAMVFLGSVLYIVGLLLTDISYTLVDPRVRLS
ncbi:MAG: ABC transporter permease [Salinisphaera sp.]|nr:ABC transporter permease [Salinisphaera sp.]